MFSQGRIIPVEHKQQNNTVMKKVVIMGASSGMGYAVAEALASRGVKVGIAARHTTSMKALKEKYPDFVEYESIDITHRDACKKLEKLIEALGGMDIYFHAAGIGYENLTLDPEREVDIIATNAGGFARMICCAYRYFRSNGRKGQIAAITSVAATKGIGRISAYSASKKFDQWYIDALEQLAHAEGADICFTDIRPGWVHTPLIPSDRKFPMEMTVEHVLPYILKAIVKRKRVEVIDWRWNALVDVWQLIPNAVWKRMKIKLSEPDSPMPNALQEIPEEPAVM